MLNDLYKEAAELSIDHNCKVGIFVAPKEIDEKSTMHAFGSPSVESVIEELKAKAPKAEKKKKKKFMAKIKRKAKLNILEGNCVAPVCGCKFGGARVTEEDANVKHEGN
ncbi:hypothetical protein RHGRI_030234 [Rhododendron griersonianum]|uniref:Uncharacterized protein n=1 Tax=Rhododendron griersonianum TaxID=479676 RepID=A0AAV6IPB5_9ERIC|nr:hypothetical protein RHGRI_030234 [Rhododendron griersonianum]